MCGEWLATNLWQKIVTHLRPGGHFLYVMWHSLSCLRIHKWVGCNVCRSKHLEFLHSFLSKFSQWHYVIHLAVVSCRSSATMVEAPWTECHYWNAFDGVSSSEHHQSNAVDRATWQWSPPLASFSASIFNIQYYLSAPCAMNARTGCLMQYYVGIQAYIIEGIVKTVERWDAYCSMGWDNTWESVVGIRNHHDGTGATFMIALCCA